MRLSFAIAGASFTLLLQFVCGSAASAEVTDVAPGEAQSDRGEKTNSDRRPFLFLDAGLGVAYVDALALRGGELLDPARFNARGFGPTLDTAVGVRPQEFTLAIRYRYEDFSGWQLSTLGGEANINWRLDRIEPYLGFSAGYAWVGGIRADISRASTPHPAPGIDIHGLNLRANVGLSYYVSRRLSIGGNLDGDAFFLRRRGDRLPRTSPTDPDAAIPFPYALDGSANGLGVALALMLGLHY